MNKICLYFLLLNALPSCNSTDYKQNFTNSSKIAFDLLKVCVDTTLGFEPDINTKKYVIDLSGISSLNKRGLDSFLSLKNLEMPIVHDDSVIIFEDKSYEKYHVKQSMVIRIKSIYSKEDRLVLVEVQKFRSNNRMFEADIELERYMDGYKLISFTKSK